MRTFQRFLLPRNLPLSKNKAAEYKPMAAPLAPTTPASPLTMMCPTPPPTSPLVYTANQVRPESLIPSAAHTKAPPRMATVL